MKRILFAIKLFLFYFLKITMLFVNFLSRLPFGFSLFKRIVAAYSLGSGSDAYREKRYDEAYKILKPIADYDINDLYVGSSQYIIGLMYYYGLGVNKNIEIGIKYLKCARERKNNDADKFLIKINR